MPRAQSYAEKLKDPRWQRKRLEVLAAANWECSNCGDNESTLHVHHNFYVRGREPWDYQDAELSALCETCHERAEDDLRELSAWLACLNVWNLRKLIGFVKALVCRATDESRVVRLRTYEEGEGFLAGAGSRLTMESELPFPCPAPGCMEASIDALAAMELEFPE